MRVDDILRTKGRAVHTIEGTASVDRAVRELRMKSIGALVVSGDGHRIDGMLSERDITMGLARHGAAVLHMTVTQIMTSPVHTCSADDSLRQIMHDMTHRRIRHLPVVSGRDLVGLISIGDVVKNRLEELELETNLMREVYLARR